MARPFARIQEAIARRPIAAFLIIGIGAYLAVVVTPLADVEVPPFDQPFDGIVGGILGVGLAAFLVTAAADGRDGVADLVARCLRWRVGVRWYAIALLGAPVATTLVATAIYGSEALESPPDGWMHVLGAVAVLFVLQFFLFQLAEEAGWTGFFQDRLRDRYSLLRLSAVVAFFWAVWHLPDFVADEPWSLELVVTLPIFFALELVLLFFARVFIVWLYERTNRSVLLVVVFHASFDATISRLAEELIPSSDAVRFMIVNAIVITAAAAVLVAWRRTAARERAALEAPAAHA